MTRKMPTVVVVAGTFVSVWVFWCCAEGTGEQQDPYGRPAIGEPPGRDQPGDGGGAGASMSDIAVAEAWAATLQDGTIDALACFAAEWPDAPQAGDARSRLREAVSVKFQCVDKRSVLLTEGFPYRRDHRFGYKRRLQIERIERGIFVTVGDTYFVPLCMESAESIRRREQARQAGDFVFESLDDAIGVTWSFARSGITFEVDGVRFRSMGPRSLMRFTENGVETVLFHLSVKCNKGQHVTLFQAEYQDILEAAANGDINAVELFASESHDVLLSADDDGLTPLHYATTGGHTELVEWLLKRDCNPSVTDSKGRTPVHTAAGWGALPAMLLLLEAGAALDAPASYSLTPLHCAIYGGQIDVVKVLIEKGADLQAREGERGMQALHIAVGAKKTDIVKLLLQAGADPSVETEEGMTALDIAEYVRDEAIAEMLKANSAAIDDRE